MKNKKESKRVYSAPSFEAVNIDMEENILQAPSGGGGGTVPPITDEPYF